MCVICVKPAGAEMPSKDMFKAMYKANSDGCGFCTPTKSYKGLSFASFMREIKEVEVKEPCIIHFRWATHGSVKRSNCHPFYDPETGVWFAHNGVLGIKPMKDKTDSETAFLKVLKPEIMAHGYESDDLRYAVHQIIGGSKFAMLQGDNLKLFGSFERYRGCFFSNLRFLPYMNDYRLRHNIRYV